MDFIYGICCFMIFIIIFILIPLFLNYIAIKLAINNERKEKLAPIDFAKEKEYYREILKEYTPAEISYIDDFKINTKREIVATLLNLELKKRIKLMPNEIIVIDCNTIGLSNSEKFILKNIKEGRVKIEKEGEFHQIIKKEARLDGLTMHNEVENDNKIIEIGTSIRLIIWFLIFFILCIFAEYGENFFLALVGILIWGVLTTIGVPLTSMYKRTYFIMKMLEYKRSENGEKLNEKIEGLKQYIKDYSLLNEKKKEELILWEEYLIYSVIFDLNDTEIVESISRLIDIKYELGKIYFIKKEKKSISKIIMPK